MDILENLLTRVREVNKDIAGGEILKESIIRHKEDILHLQREQLFAGIASDGQYIHPFYSEDVKPKGYFKNRQSAKRYTQWKTTLSYPASVTRGNDDAPNLYINGKFHSELIADCGEEAITIDGNTVSAKQIISKYGLDTFGLSSENWEKMFSDYGITDELIDKIKQKLYGN